MKLSTLSPEQKTKLLAELGGWFFNGNKNCWYHEDDSIMSESSSCPKYLTSYDAIIPLIQKHINTTEKAHKFAFALGGYGESCCYYAGDTIMQFIKFTPSQLGDALLVAAGRAEL